MFTSLPTRLKKACRWLPVALLPFAAQAQFAYQPGNAVNTTGTYTDLATDGTAITTANTDDANSTAQPIGFSFSLNGVAFTQFVLNTNGLIRLGAAGPSSAMAFPDYAQAPDTGPISGTNAADVNLIAPFNTDLMAGTGTTEYRYFTSGTAPNRVCTIQWKNVADKAQLSGVGGVLITTQYANFSFQAKLYETSNQVEFVYGTATAGTGTANAKFVAVGVKGLTPAASVVATKGSTSPWSATTFLAGPYTAAANAHNVRQNVLPDPGRTYRFIGSVANDAAVTALYTQGQLSNVSPNHVVSAVISNRGTAASTANTATLTVTRGATVLFTDTQPVASVAVGGSSTVSFNAYPTALMSNLGTNMVTVTLANDGNNTNNIASLDQVVSATAFNYASPAVATPGGLSFGATGMGNVGARYSTTTATQVVSIQAYMASGVGTATGVLFSGTGVELGRSATRTLTAADAGTVVTFTLPAPISVGPGDFLAGLNLTAGAALGSQAEVPTRTGTFYQVNAGPALVDLASSNLGRFNLGVTTQPTTPPACPAASNLTATNLSTTGASIGFTGTPGATYTVTYQAAGGAVQTVTPAPSTSPVTLTGLTLNTAYTVTVTVNCSGNTTSSASTFTFTTLAIDNDEPSGAITLPVTATCTPTNATNAGATTTNATAFGYTNPGCGIAASPKDVWFKFTTAAVGVGSTVVNIAVTGNPAGQVRVFSSTAGAAGPFTSVGCAAGTAINTVASALRVANLSPNTTYYVFVSGYGSGDTQGAFTICVTGLATPAPAAYATLPYTEGFEGPWIDVLATRDVPTNNWRNTPATGNNSWRREDDGFLSAGWSFPADETGPTPPYVIRSSVGAHSARFHTFGSNPAGLTGTLDLYANLSGAGAKRLDFDYINPTGTDKLEVLVSTDGGATFGAPILTANTNATFTAKTVTIASTSATTVIRFRATSDYGDDDIGMDNLRLTVVTGTTNEQLAATVSLYPNPAHQSFQLVVPAGILSKASATLLNALGQVVQSRQLNLPAAGGIEKFNVSGLAAGVYSLQLKSGSDTVVKRVVVE